MKRLTICLMCALMLLPLPGCAQRGKKIAFFIYDGSDTFITELMEKIQDRIPDGITAEIRDAGNSQAVQNQQIVELIGEDIDLFVINAVDRLACGSIVEKCTNEGISVIFFNREPLEDALTGESVYYVGAAADSLGKKQADMVAALFTKDFENGVYDKNGDGVVQLVILKGEQGHQDAEKRTDNCVYRLKALGFEVEVLAIEVADWVRRDAYDAMSRLYARFGDEIELVFANNDDMALGAIDYMLEIGQFSEYADRQPFVIVGVDATAVGLEAIDKGLLYGTVHNDSNRQAAAILSLADLVLNGGDLSEFPYELKNEHYIYIDGDIITRHNLAEYTGLQ